MHAWVLLVFHPGSTFLSTGGWEPVLVRPIVPEPGRLAVQREHQLLWEYRIMQPLEYKLVLCFYLCGLWMDLKIIKYDK